LADENLLALVQAVLHLREIEFTSGPRC
jgi:hypothetical protein